jgi:hypothetical protein
MIDEGRLKSEFAVSGSLRVRRAAYGLQCLCYKPTTTVNSLWITAVERCKSRCKKGLCLAQRRRERQESIHLWPFLLCGLGVLARAWFWLRPQAALGSLCPRRCRKEARHESAWAKAHPTGLSFVFLVSFGSSRFPPSASWREMISLFRGLSALPNQVEAGGGGLEGAVEGPEGQAAEGGGGEQVDIDVAQGN